MSVIKVVGFDPSMSNFGICKASVDIDTLAVTIEDLILVKTTGESKKGVIKVSDDLRRARHIYGHMILSCVGRSLAISEIPLGTAALYNNAILSAGIVTGVLASCPIPIIQVFPKDVKMTAIGDTQAAKEEMIEWGMGKYPDAPWLMRKLKGKMVPMNDNEHLADAVATVETGLKTDQFLQAISMARSMAA